MGITLTGNFATRREAEMAVEHLVQEDRIERTDIFIAPGGAENSAGSDMADSEENSALDPKLEGMLSVSVDLQNEALAATVRDVFASYNAQDVAQR